MPVATETLDAEILAEIIAPDSDEMPLDVAQAVLKFAFSDSQKEQMRELADKNNCGTLTDSERVQMESYLRVGQVLSIVHAKARLAISRGHEHGG